VQSATRNVAPDDIPGAIIFKRPRDFGRIAPDGILIATIMHVLVIVIPIRAEPDSREDGGWCQENSPPIGITMPFRFREK